ncbi:CU044_5270 family protein [Nonomuraea sp. NPDC051941]|uniref:CU044_5270 family protein n=1 Tax=Nonomuraea sp. NPDC051941 TaxID=3364373 RepID=UPI0037CBA1E6
MTRVERFRSEVPQPDPDRLRVHEDRLLAAIAQDARRRPRRTTSRLRRLGLATGLAAALAAGVVVVTTHRADPPAIIHPMPAAASEVLTRAAQNVTKTPELHPEPGQFLVYESRTMNPATGEDRAGRPMRYLSRAVRKVWLPVDGDATGGFIEEEVLEPKPWPGWPIPPEARENVGSGGGPSKLADFDDRAEFLRNDYAYVSRLPTDPRKMYEHLYTRLGNTRQDDTEAWDRVRGLLTEAYLPAAQRAALFRAAAAIPGVVTVEHAVDAAGRAGIAAARVDPVLGQRQEYIFDRETYLYLGERSVVTDAARAGAPVGTVLTSSAQLSVSVAGHAPSAAVRD